jgi:hypothetical protein
MLRVGRATVKLSGWVAVALAVSVASTVNGKLPATAGSPLITPDVELSDRPEGSEGDPAANDQA